MKRVTLLLPDTMIYQHGDKRGVNRDEINVDAESIVDALSYKWEYHLDYYFPSNTIKVETIENVK